MQGQESRLNGTLRLQKGLLSVRESGQAPQSWLHHLRQGSVNRGLASGKGPSAKYVQIGGDFLSEAVPRKSEAHKRALTSAGTFRFHWRPLAQRGASDLAGDARVLEKSPSLNQDSKAWRSAYRDTLAVGEPRWKTVSLAVSSVLLSLRVSAAAPVCLCAPSTCTAPHIYLHLPV